MQYLITDYRIVSNIFFSDNSALQLRINHKEQQTKREPVFWKFNNSLLTDKEYIELVTKSIPKCVSKYEDLVYKGPFWE